MTANDTGMNTAPSNDEIAQKAYHIWLSEGCPAGRSQHHWKLAEEELKARVNLVENKDQPISSFGRRAISGYPSGSPTRGQSDRSVATKAGKERAL